MKKIYSYATMLLAGALALTSCSDDNDSNPTLVTPEAGSFILNEPTVGQQVVDLAKSAGITLKWSQPQFTNPNAPVQVAYDIEVSTTNSFTKEYSDAEDADNTGVDFVTLGQPVNTCSTSIVPSDLITVLEKMNGWDETTLPDTVTVYARVHAKVKDAGFNVRSEVVSNVVVLRATPYYIELKAADPELWWLTGSDICDGSWGGTVGTSVIPLQTVDGFAYDAKTGMGEFVWTGYLAGNGFKLRYDLNDSKWNRQWGQGDAFGSYKKNDGGSANITVPEAGYYTIKLNTLTDELNITAISDEPAVYTSICISGSFNDWGDTEMSPCFTFAGAVNHDWYTTVELDGTQEIKFKEAGSWDYNTGGSFNLTQAGDLYGYGEQNGANIKPEAGKYLVLYNDITRYYRFIRQ